MTFSLEEVDPSWRPFFSDHINSINDILSSLNYEEISPARENIFRAFTSPLDDVRVLILGQDPYPGIGVADGLAFSSPQSRIPPHCEISIRSTLRISLFLFLRALT